VSRVSLTWRVRAAYGPAMTEPDAPEPSALRLVFAYDGDDVRVVSSRQVDMVVPEVGEPAAAEPPPGLRAEVRDAGGAVLDRRMVPAVPADVEVFSPEPGRTVRRVPVDRPSGMFVVLVPYLPEADHVALLSDAGGPAEARAVREIARVPLRRAGGGATS
jgi:hypothetical protein